MVGAAGIHILDALRKPTAKPIDHQPRIDQLKAEIGNLVDAIAGGVLRPSLALATRLAAAEAEMGELEAAKSAIMAPAADVTLLLARPARPCQAGSEGLGAYSGGGRC